DTCGTGGDGSNTFNISTTASFIVAGAGVPVAKHGNRGASSKSGSADVLSALGVNLELTPEKVAQCIEHVGIGFMFAVAFHPAMKHAIGPRREMGVRTVFNVLGPLTKPANVRRQVMGVYAKNLTESIAHVFKELGSEHVLVVCGDGGLDELTTTGVNFISELHQGEVTTYTLDPTELGLKPVTLADIQGGEPTDNARITREVLSGNSTPAQREIVLLNAAAGLTAADKVKNIREGLQLAAQILDSGKALEKLDALVAYSQDIAQ
ncbi:MAG: anthranilate phosphoribosyltransferase, partial [Anaerolineae bacterium]|nr:anthranilate phosphoribosyltransferase [Anaerolineae bacterium]